MYIVNSSKREKTPWTNFCEKHGPKKKENGEYLFDESRRKELAGFSICKKVAGGKS